MRKSNFLCLILLYSCGQEATTRTTDSSSPQPTTDISQLSGQYEWTSTPTFQFDRNPFDGSGVSPKIDIQPLQQNGMKWKMRLTPQKSIAAGKTPIMREMSGIDLLKFEIKNPRSADDAQVFEFSFGCASDKPMKFESLFENRLYKTGLDMTSDLGDASNPCPNTWQNGIMKVTGPESGYVKTKTVKFDLVGNTSDILMTSEIDLLFTGKSTIGVTIGIKFSRVKSQ